MGLHLGVMAITQALSPVDLIPDFIPVLGFLDDVILVPLGVILVVKLIPPGIMEEHRVSAAAVQHRAVSRLATVVIVLVWTICIAFAAWLYYRSKRSDNVRQRPGDAMVQAANAGRVIP